MKNDWGGSFDDLDYHFREHHAEVKAKDFDDYLRKASAFRDTVLGKYKKPSTDRRPGKNSDVFRYRHNDTYIDLQHIYGTDMLGVRVITGYKIISYGTK